MSEVLSVKLLGLTELSARLDSISPTLQDRLRIFFAAFTLRLRDRVKTNIVAYFNSTGPLYQSVRSEIEEQPGSVTGRVYTDGIAYAAIQERGGTTGAHEILPIKGSVLAFMAPGRLGFSSGGGSNGLVFAKAVNHPGSRIPEHPYARLALVQSRYEFEGGIRGVVDEAVGYAMAAE